MPDKTLVIDATILVRAVLGVRVRRIIEQHAGHVLFFAPEIAVADAEEHLPLLLAKRGGEPEKALALLHALTDVIEVLTADTYGHFESVARSRLTQRDPDDWPVLAAALALRCPIWTEDTELFGCGVATWTSALVEEFLND